MHKYAICMAALHATTERGFDDTDTHSPASEAQTRGGRLALAMAAGAVPTETSCRVPVPQLLACELLVLLLCMAASPSSICLSVLLLLV